MPYPWLVQRLQLPCRTARNSIMTSSATPPPLRVRPSYGNSRSFDVRSGLSAATSTTPTGPASLAIRPSGRSRFYRSTGIIANLSIVSSVNKNISIILYRPPFRMTLIRLPVAFFSPLFGI